MLVQEGGYDLSTTRRRSSRRRCSASRRESSERAIASPSYLRHVVERLESYRIASTRLPRRRHARGTRGDGVHRRGDARRRSESTSSRRPVPVDAWRLEDAYVELDDGIRFECASFGGVPETRASGIAAELVVVGRGGRRQLDRLDVGGKVALVDWEVARLWPYHVGLELGLRGAVAMIVTSPPGGPYYQAPDALGTFDGIWHAEAPPCVTIRKEDAARARAACRAVRRVVLTAPLTRGAEAANVVGVLPGRRDVLADDRRRSPRRLVPRRLRRRERGRDHACACARFRGGGPAARAADRLRLAHGGGVRADKLVVRLVLRRLVPDRRGASGVVDGRNASISTSRARLLRDPVHARHASRATPAGSERLCRRAASDGLLPHGFKLARADDLDRSVALSRRGGPRNQRLDVHRCVRPARVPHAVRHVRPGGLRLPRGSRGSVRALVA